MVTWWSLSKREASLSDVAPMRLIGRLVGELGWYLCATPGEEREDEDPNQFLGLIVDFLLLWRIHLSINPLGALRYVSKPIVS